MSYTPAPWKWLYLQEDDGEIVYRVIPVQRPDGGAIPNKDDAALIAAAPELLHALEQLVEAVAMARCDPMPVEHIVLANKAILKAKGEKP